MKKCLTVLAALMLFTTAAQAQHRPGPKPGPRRPAPPPPPPAPRVFHAHPHGPRVMHTRDWVGVGADIIGGIIEAEIIKNTLPQPVIVTPVQPAPPTPPVIIVPAPQPAPKVVEVKERWLVYPDGTKVKIE